MDVTCYNCGVLHTIEEDGSTDHSCADALVVTPPRSWSELLAALNRIDDQPSSNSRTYGTIGNWNLKSPETSMGPNTLDLGHINLALGLDKHGNGVMSLNNPNNMFPSFLDQSPAGSANMAGMQRQAPSPIVGQHQANNANGGGAMNGMNVGMPMNAGSQMDYNLLYQKVMELAQVLHENREQTKGIVASAEELAVSLNLHLWFDGEPKSRDA